MQLFCGSDLFWIGATIYDPETKYIGVSRYLHSEALALCHDSSV